MMNIKGMKEALITAEKILSYYENAYIMITFERLIVYVEYNNVKVIIYIDQFGNVKLENINSLNKNIEIIDIFKEYSFLLNKINNTEEINDHKIDLIEKINLINPMSSFIVSKEKITITIIEKLNTVVLELTDMGEIKYLLNYEYINQNLESLIENYKEEVKNYQRKNGYNPFMQLN